MNGKLEFSTGVLLLHYSIFALLFADTSELYAPPLWCAYCDTTRPFPCPAQMTNVLPGFDCTNCADRLYCLCMGTNIPTFCWETPQCPGRWWPRIPPGYSTWLCFCQNTYVCTC